jgi:hypothetical protein
VFALLPDRMVAEQPQTHAHTKSFTADLDGKSHTPHTSSSKKLLKSYEQLERIDNLEHRQNDASKDQHEIDAIEVGDQNEAEVKEQAAEELDTAIDQVMSQSHHRNEEHDAEDLAQELAALKRQDEGHHDQHAVDPETLYAGMIVGALICGLVGVGIVASQTMVREEEGTQRKNRSLVDVEEEEEENEGSPLQHQLSHENWNTGSQTPVYMVYTGSSPLSDDEGSNWARELS